MLEEEAPAGLVLDPEDDEAEGVAEVGGLDEPGSGEELVLGSSAASEILSMEARMLETILRVSTPASSCL